MFGFFFNKKSKSFDKENNGKSSLSSASGSHKKCKETKDSSSRSSTSSCGESNLSSENGSSSNSNSSGDFVLSGSSEKDSEPSTNNTDLKTSLSTGSLPNKNNNQYGSDIQSAFHSHEDIPFHDEDTTEEDEDDKGIFDKDTAVSGMGSSSENNKKGPGIPIPPNHRHHRRLGSNASIADANKHVRLSSSPTKSELSLKLQREYKILFMLYFNIQYFNIFPLSRSSKTQNALSFPAVSKPTCSSYV